jgi:hypothetical protein
MRKEWPVRKDQKCRLCCFDLGIEFRKLLQNPSLENELSSHPYVKNSPINIKDALYGGKTEAMKTY